MVAVMKCNMRCAQSSKELRLEMAASWTLEPRRAGACTELNSCFRVHVAARR